MVVLAARGGGPMNPAEETYVGLLVMAVFWTLFSGGCVVASAPNPDAAKAAPEDQ
jgi:hypothetical protein